LSAVLNTGFLARLLSYPKFVLPSQIPGVARYVVGTGRPVVVIKYTYTVASRDRLLHCIGYILELYRTTQSRYYVHALCESPIDTYTTGYAFRLSREELFDFLDKVFACVAELYPDEYRKVTRLVKLALEGFRFDKEIELCNWVDLDSKHVRVVEKLRIYTY